MKSVKDIAANLSDHLPSGVYFPKDQRDRFCEIIASEIVQAREDAMRAAGVVFVKPD
jgi:hypothetical protein